MVLRSQESPTPPLPRLLWRLEVSGLSLQEALEQHQVPWVRSCRPRFFVLGQRAGNGEAGQGKGHWFRGASCQSCTVCIRLWSGVVSAAVSMNWRTYADFFSARNTCADRFRIETRSPCRKRQCCRATANSFPERPPENHWKTTGPKPPHNRKIVISVIIAYYCQLFCTFLIFASFKAFRSYGPFFMSCHLVAWKNS